MKAARIVSGRRVDFGRVRRSVVAVSGIGHKFLAICVLAFWLVATQHCGLEAAGVFGAHAEEELAGCCTTGGGCVTDECGTVEDGNYRSDNTVRAMAAPQLTVCAVLTRCRITVPPRGALPAVGRGHFEPRLDWIPTWQFVRRAALSPRAPSLV